MYPLVLEAPDVFGEAGSTALAGVFEVLLVVGMPHLPLRLGDPQVGLVRHLLLLQRVLGDLHLDGGLVHHLLGDAFASQRALLKPNFSKLPVYQDCSQLSHDKI